MWQPVGNLHEEISHSSENLPISLTPWQEQTEWSPDKRGQWWVGPHFDWNYLDEHILLLNYKMIPGPQRQTRGIYWISLFLFQLGSRRMNLLFLLFTISLAILAGLLRTGGQTWLEAQGMTFTFVNSAWHSNPLVKTWMPGFKTMCCLKQRPTLAR